MAKINPIQESFAAGEITPKLLGRRSIEGYSSGVATMHNMIADPRGPGIGRNGFRYAQSFIANAVRLSLLPSNTTNLLLVLTDELLTITGVLGVLPDANFVTNGDFESTGTGWLTSATGGGASVNFGVGECIMDSGPVGRSYLSQQLTLSGTGTHTVIVRSDGVTNYRVRVGDTEDSAEYLDVSTSETRFELDITIGVTNPFVTVIRDAADGGSRIINVTRIIVAGTVAQLEFATPWPEDELRNLYFIRSSDGTAEYILHPNYAPQKILNEAGVVSFGAVVFTNPPAEWTGTNWPSAGAIFQGRLWLGGTPAEPETFWGSKSGDRQNFDTGTGLDDEAIAATMSQYGPIVWIMGTKKLLIGTLNGEHVVSSEGGVITPTDFGIDQQSAYGSKRVQPVQVGDQIFYVSRDGTKVRAMQYDWSADNWLSKDLTFFSEHITASGIQGISWAPNPDNLLHCVLNDGTMAWCSYERGENVWGWHRHSTAGEILDTAVATVDGFSITITAVIRVTGEVYIETATHNVQQYMDSWTEKQNLETAFTVFDQLEHLEGLEVQLLVDGAVAPNQVVSGGQVTLEAPANTAVAGLQFTPKMVSLPLASGAPTGSSLAHIKRYNRLIIGLLDSALPLINGVRAPDRTPSTPMNTVEPNSTGQVSAYQLGWSEGATVTIEQDLPLALTVLYIGGELPQDVL